MDNENRNKRFKVLLSILLIVSFIITFFNYRLTPTNIFDNLKYEDVLKKVKFKNIEKNT